jgi:SPP1 gp7 family putative phage head morphogenesis protein
MPRNYWTQANKLLDNYYERLSNYETKEWSSLTKGWVDVQKHIETKIDDLAKEALKKELSEDKLFKSQLYQDFLKTSSSQIKKYSLYAEASITEGQKFYAENGIAVAQDAISLVKVNFYRINVSAVDSMIGQTSEGERLYNLLYKSYPDNIDKLTKILVNNTALGQSPEVTARMMKNLMNNNYVRSLTIARTEQMNVYHRSAIEQYKDSKVVSGWKRIEQSDCCDECAAANGEEYELDEVFDSHPRCRGGTLPIIYL